VSPSLLKPGEGETVLTDKIEFEWEGSLRINWSFRVILTHESGQVFPSPDLQDTTWSIGPPDGKVGGFRWQVVIVQNDNIIARSEESSFWFAPFQGKKCPQPEPKCEDDERLVCEDGQWKCVPKTYPNTISVIFGLSKN
jgi:hypothetical protein